MNTDLTRPPLASANMTIGLLGGSFNPPHFGHAHISDVALRRLGLDRLWWLVTPGNPIKDNGDLTALQTRIAYARALIHDPRIDITGFEATSTSNYSADTIRLLQKRFPDTHFIWIMGADNLAGFHKWDRWKEIFDLIPIAVIDRPGYRYKALSSKAARYYDEARIFDSDARGLARLAPPVWCMLSSPLSPHSSTEIRRDSALNLQQDNA